MEIYVTLWREIQTTEWRHISVNSLHMTPVFHMVNI